MTGYTRQSIPQIIPGEEITAGPLNDEFNQIQSAFHGSNGHKHTGGSGDSPPINLTTSVVNFLRNANGGSGTRWNTSATINPSETDDISQNYDAGSVWVNILEGRLFICISGLSDNATWAEITQLVENELKPAIGNTINIGSTTRKFKNLYLSGVANLTSISGFSLNGPIDANSNEITNLSGPINPNDAANKNYVDFAISSLINGSPGVLDTLNELASALGNDPDFATTITDSIATKLSLSGGEMSGNINMASNRIVSLPEPTSPTEPTTKNYIDNLYGTIANAAQSASNAASSASKASNSADEAKLSESNAAQSENRALNSANSAANSELNASDSASSAALSETNAKASENNAAQSASSAASSASTANNAASTATTAASNASNSASAASTSEDNAAVSESNAAQSESNALESEDKAQQWANESEDVEVEPGEFSAYHWSQKAQTYNPEPFNSHIGNTDNPHKTTAAQVGAYTEAQVNDLIRSRAPKDETAEALAGKLSKEANLSDLSDKAAALQNLGVKDAAVAADRYVLLARYGSANLNGLSSIVLDIPDEFECAEISFAALSGPQISSFLIRCGEVGGALLAGAGNYRNRLMQVGDEGSVTSTAVNRDGFLITEVASDNTFKTPAGRITLWSRPDTFWTAEAAWSGLYPSDDSAYLSYRSATLNDGGKKNRTGLIFGTPLTSGSIAIYGVRT